MAEVRARLAPVDGLRGLAAMMVVVGHVHQHGGAPTLGGVGTILANLGIGVNLFFVLSGFCLFYPLTAPGALPDWPLYFMRRARRILPPYYAALVAVIALPFVLAPVGRHLGLAAIGTPAWPGWTQVVTHVLLIHSLSPTTMFSLDGPFWSLGTEMQFYLVFPVAVWLVHRYNWQGIGIIAAITLAYRCGLWYFAHLSQHDMYLGAGNGSLDVLVNLFPGTWLQFGLGMAIAMLVRRARNARKGRRALFPSVVLLLLAGEFFQHSGTAHWLLPIGDTLVAGSWSLLLLAACTEGTVAARVFGQPLLVAIGTISYSLYLIHDPLLIALTPAVFALRLGSAASTAVLGAVGVPLALLCATGFYKLFEQPFLRRPARRLDQESPRILTPLGPATDNEVIFEASSGEVLP